MKRKFSLRVVLLGITAFILSLLTLVLGAPFIKTLRRAYPPLIFWGLGIAFSVVCGPLWYFVGLPWFLVGLNTELEIRGMRYDRSGFISSIVTCLVFVGAIYALTKMGVDIAGYADMIVDSVVEAVKRMNPSSELTRESFFEQIPSMFFGTFITILATAAALERTAHILFRYHYHKPESVGDYFDFRVPSWAFWVSLFGMAMLVLGSKSPWLATVGMNLVNIFMILYFIQGAIITECYLRAMQAGVLWRIIIYFFMMGPLALGVVAIGFVDFWLDFRVRIQKLSSPNMNNEL